MFATMESFSYFRPIPPEASGRDRMEIRGCDMVRETSRPESADPICARLCGLGPGVARPSQSSSTSGARISTETRSHAASRPDEERRGGAVQCRPAVLHEQPALRRRVSLWRVLLAQVARCAGPYRLPARRGGVRSDDRRHCRSHVARRPAAGHQSLFVGDLHRLGRGGALPGARTFYRTPSAASSAGVVGFATLVIAHHLALGGDTMEMMRAVLDTNFWLATHVVAITLGYAATFVAGFLAIDLRRCAASSPRTLDEATAEALARMVYGIVCFATLFSFVGTVLGGIWADQSWGRFWGWDPKENGALIIVLWNAHHPARALGRLVRAARPGVPGDLRQHRHRLVLVRREHARRRPASFARQNAFDTFERAAHYPHTLTAAKKGMGLHAQRAFDGPANRIDLLLGHRHDPLPAADDHVHTRRSQNWKPTLVRSSYKNVTGK